MSRLSRMVILGGADIDRLEAKLYAAVASGSITKISHESKNYLHDLKMSARTEDISTPLLKLLSSWLEITLSPEQKSLTKKVDYIVTTWRVAIAISQVVDLQDKSVIEIVESFAYDQVYRFNSYTLIYIYWINLIHKNSERTKLTASEIDPVIMSVINEKLIKEFCSMAHYDSGIGLENQALLTNNLPPSLYLGPLDLFYERSLEVIKDEACSNRLKVYVGLMQWNEGNRGKGISHIASVCEYWLNGLDNEMYSSLGLDVLMCLTSVIDDITSNNLSPAHEFLAIMCDSLQIHPSASIIHYFYYIYLDHSKEIEDQDRKKSLVSKYPILTSLKDEEFESSLLNNIGNIEKKRSIILKFLQNKLNSSLTQKYIQSQDKSITSKHVFPVSEKIQQELLDIELLQCMQEKEFSKAVNTIASSCEQKLLPSDVVTMLLVKNLYEQNDLIGLQTLRKYLVSCPELRNDIFKAEIKLSMKNAYTLWKDGGRQLALEDSLLQYQMILTNHNELTSSTVQTALSSVLNYIKLFIEELCHDEDNMALDNVESYGRKCYSDFGDTSLLVLQWETLFFSHKHSHHVLAREFLERNSNIIYIFDLAKQIDLAVKYNKEYYLLELFNTSVDYKLSSETKEKSLAALIVYYCDCLNHKALRECMKKAMQHKIPISTDLQRKIENIQHRNKLYSKFMEYFKPPT